MPSINHKWTLQQDGEPAHKAYNWLSGKRTSTASQGRF